MNGRTATPSLLILGADTVLAAHPATAVQLAHACLADGFDHVIPGSWGDELVAEHLLARLRDDELPALQCSCPLVAQRLAAHGAALEPMLRRTVAPPIALGRHLRSAFAPNVVTLTYAGGCPAGVDAVFDAWITPEELFTRLDRRGLSLGAQPTAFDAVLSPDRRRYWSEPGGVPHAQMLARNGVDVRTLSGDDVVPELADVLLSQRRVLVDIALSVRCACSGAAHPEHGEAGRRRLAELEPPRALSPVIETPADEAMRTGDAPAESRGDSVPDDSRELARVSTPSSPSPILVGAVPTPRRTPAGVSRAVLGAMPLTRRDRGRQLPRAYIARRRSSPRGMLAERATQATETDSLDRRRRGALVAAVGTLGLIAGLALAWLARLFF